MTEAKEEEKVVEKAKKAPAKKAAGTKRKVAEKHEEEAVEEEETAEEKLPSPKFGTVKVHTDDAPAGKRTRRVMKTFYNDSGEEVTEMVEETDDEAPSPAIAAPAPAAAAAHAAAKPKSPKPSGGAGNAKKGAAKGPPAGQRSIAGFFSKK
jgi:DNA polymerase delta subunit 3